MKLKSYLYLSVCIAIGWFHSIEGQVLTPVITANPKDFGGKVNCFFQDSPGFIWLGKENGLFRFDGEQLKSFNYDAADTSSLGNDNIQSIYGDNYGNLWIGTKGGGLNFYNRRTGNFKKYLHDDKIPGSIAYNEIFTLVPGEKDHLLLGTDGGGLDVFSIQKGFAVHFNQMNSGLKSNKVLAILPDGKGNYWLGTWDGGLHFMNGHTAKIEHIPGTGNIQFPQVDKHTGNLNIFKIAEVKPGILWLATWGQGLIAYDIKKNKFSEVIPAGRIPFFRDILRDKKDNIWLASNAGVLKFPSGNENYVLIPEKNKPVTGASSFLYDQTQSIWIGYENGSVARINSIQRKFHTFNLTGSGQPGVTSILESRFDHHLYITAGNIFICANNRGKLLYTLKGPYADLVNIQELDKDLMICSSSDGLSCFDRRMKKFTKILSKSSLSGKQIWTLYSESPDKCWVGALGQASLIGKDGNNDWHEIQTFPTGQHNGLSRSHYPACFLQDGQGNLWIGTFGGGLNRLSGGKSEWSCYTQHAFSTNGLSDNYVECLLEDRMGNIWIGTHNGLDCLRKSNQRIVHYSLTNGLQNNWIASLTEDQHGNIWISTHGGISCITKAGDIRNFDVDDGLPTNNFLVRSTALLQNGWLCFGSTHGMVRFHPDSLFKNPYQPLVVITELKVNDQPEVTGLKAPIPVNIELADTVTLTKDQHSFSFHMVALNCFSPKKSRYSYKLEGFDKEWHFAGNDHWAKYPNVPSGKYIFRARASNSDGIWSAREKTVVLLITGSPWISGYAFLGYFTTLGILIIAFKNRKYFFKGTASNSVLASEQPDNHYITLMPSEVILEPADQVFIQKALKIVEEHMSEPTFGVDELCYHICISRPQLYRKIQAITGLSVTEFIKDIRLKRAAQLLRQNPESIAEIAYNLGFNDPKYFSKCFKLKFGISPAHYLQENERKLPPKGDNIPPL